MWGAGNKFAVLTDRNEVGIGQVPTGEGGNAIAVDLSDLSSYKMISFDFFVENIFGGQNLGVAGADSCLIYSWEAKSVGLLEVECRGIQWDKNIAVVQAPKSFFVLRLNLAENQFELLHEVKETIASSCFHQGFFFFLNEQAKFHVLFDGLSLFLGHTNKATLLLGYVQNHERFFFLDLQNKLSSCHFSKNLLDILRMGKEKILADGEVTPEVAALSEEDKDLLSRAYGNDLALAYRVCGRSRRKFDLGLKLRKLDECLEICREMNDPQLWKKLGDACLERGKFGLAEQCYRASHDYSSLLLLFSSLSNFKGMRALAEETRAKKIFNVSFSAYWALADLPECLALLIAEEKFGQAVALAKNYLPEKSTEVLEQWKQHLGGHDKRDSGLTSRVQIPQEGKANS